MGDGYKNRGSNAAGLGFKNRGAKLLDGAAYANRGATDGTHETFKNRGQAWGTGVFYNRSVSDFASLSILGSAAFFAPLKSTLVLTRGTGNPTYSRATAAWEFDNEGKLITVPSGAARFGGSRMIRNLLTTHSVNVGAGGSWGVTGAPTITYAGGICTVTTPGAGTECKITQYPSFSQLTPYNAGKVATAKWVIRGTNGETIYLGIQEGSPGFETNEFVHTFNGSWQTVTSTKTLVSATGTLCGITFRKATAGAAITFEIMELSLENVTGQADQTASEYVSVGVLSAPYHGAGVDGVKWFETNKNGSAISESSLLGYHAEGARTNSLLYSRDLSQASAWTVTNVTATKTATGIDNAANSASTLTAGAANATILQTLTLAAAARSSSAYVKRRTGTGSIYMTRDGGSNWTDITASVGASWTRVKIENSSVLNPSIGFKIATSGDAIDVDCVQDEAGAFVSSPIITTTAAVTRNADALTYQTASNWSDTAGWMLASVYKPDWSYVAGGVIGSATNGLLPLTSNTGAKAYDGTNTVNGPVGAPTGTVKMAATWGSGALQVAANGTAGTAGSYDGAWGLATIGINTSAGAMYTKNIYIDDAAISATQLAQVTA